MPNWSDLGEEIKKLGSPYDILRRKYIKNLSELTGRNVICYYSGWMQKPELGSFAAVNDVDKNGLMTTVNGLDSSKGLDLVLHTPGGDTAATESIVDYLWKIFDGNIRCFVPQMAMSAGTMIACSTKEIWMGKHSSLGPVDPQFNGIPAHGILEEFQRARTEIHADPKNIPLWQPIIARYNPAIIGECEKAITWSNQLIENWLDRNMLKDDPDKQNKISTIVTELGDHSVSYAHNRHLSSQKCKEIGLVIKDLEDDQELQDAVLSLHHIFFHTLIGTNAFKIIENQDGKAFIQAAQAVQVQNAPQQIHGEQLINEAEEKDIPK